MRRFFFGKWYFPEKNLLQIVPKKEKIPYKNVEKNQLTNVEIYEKINTSMDVKEITNLYDKTNLT